MADDVKDGVESDSRITEERIAAMRSRIGVRRPVAGWNRTVTHEGVQRFARGIGDDNPLWWDADYAAASPSDRPTAPPCYLYSHANDMPDNAAPGSGPFDNHLPGALALWAGDRWRWHRPVQVGETVLCEQSLADVRVENGARTENVSLTQVEYDEFRTTDSELVAEHWQTFKRFDKQAMHASGSTEPRAHGFFSDLDVRLRGPNVLNDVSWIKGRVTVVDCATASADLAISVVNQRDEESARATATVRLPRRAA